MKEAIEWYKLLTEREQKEVDFAGLYATEYNHGTAGHNRLILIFKLAEILSEIQENNPDVVFRYHDTELPQVS